MNTEVELDLAIDIAFKAGRFLSKQKQDLNKTIYSEKKDIKLEADIKTEELIKSLIIKSSHFPILGEESGPSSNDLGDTYWVVDPLDGTANFARNIPICCVSIALINDHKPVLGVIYDFNNDEMYSGSINRVAMLNNKEISVSDTPNKELAIIATGLPAQTNFSDESMQRMINDFQSWKKVRMIGSAAMSAAFVASGKVDFYKEFGIFLWDIAAGAAIVKAAGGSVSLLNMNENFQVDAFFSNKRLENEHN